MTKKGGSSSETIKPKPKTKPKTKPKPKTKKVVAKGLSNVELLLKQQRMDIKKLEEDINKLRKKQEKTKEMSYRRTKRRTSKRLAYKREASKR